MPADSVCDRLFAVRWEDTDAIIKREGLKAQNYYVQQIRPNANRTKLFIQLRGWPNNRLLIASSNGLELIESGPLVAYYDELLRPIAWSTNLSKQGITFTNGLTLESGHFRLDYSGKYFVHTIRNQIYVGVPGTKGIQVVTNAYGRNIFTTSRGLIVVGDKKVLRKEKQSSIRCFWVVGTNAGGFFSVSERIIPGAKYVQDVDASGRWFLCVTPSDLSPKRFVYDSLLEKTMCKKRRPQHSFFDIEVPIDAFKSRTIARTPMRTSGK